MKIFLAPFHFDDDFILFYGLTVNLQVATIVEELPVVSLSINNHSFHKL